MASDFTISEVRIRLYRGKSKGFLGWASCLVNGGLFLNNIEIQRRRDGTLFVSFPTQRPRSGVSHHYFCPVNRETLAAIEDAILRVCDGLRLRQAEAIPPGTSCRKETE